MSAIINHEVTIVCTKIEGKRATIKVYSKLDGDTMEMLSGNSAELKVGDDIILTQPIEIYGRRGHENV